MTGKTRLLKVLYITHSSIIGGAETNLLNIINFSQTGGFQPVGVLVPREGILSHEVRMLDLPVGIINYYGFEWRNPFRYFSTLLQLGRWIYRTNPDAIHLNHQWLIEYVSVVGVLFQIPVICHYRNYPDELFIKNNLRWLKRANAIVVESQAVAKRMAELKLPMDRLHMIYNGIDPVLFCGSRQSSTLRNTLNLADDNLVIGFLGRIVPEKGPEDLLVAYQEVAKEFPKSHLIFTGDDQEDGKYIRHLRKFTQEKSLTDQVSFIGYRQDVENVLATYDVLVFPTRQSMPESFGLSVVEGMAAGCIVIATRYSAVTEIISDRENGFLVDSDNPMQLAEAIRQVIRMSEEEKSFIKQQASQSVGDKFNIRKQVDLLGKLYQSIAK